MKNDKHIIIKKNQKKIACLLSPMPQNQRSQACTNCVAFHFFPSFRYQSWDRDRDRNLFLYRDLLKKKKQD